MSQRRFRAEAPANIAFVKYWGARDSERVIPWNASISMTLDRCRAICRASFDPSGTGDDTVFFGADADSLEPAAPAFAERARRHLARLREARQGDVPRGRFEIRTWNTFPHGAGIASSAAGFSALTLAGTRALGLELSAEELSGLARLESGSAARSLWGGYVEWPKGFEDQACHGFQIAGDAWQLCDVIAIVQSGEKKVSSLDGHLRAESSPYYRQRQELLPQRLAAVRAAIESRDLAGLGAVMEEEAIDLHLIAMSSQPAIFYWNPATLAVLAKVRELREQGLSAWSTMDAGANVHVICEPADESEVSRALAATPGVQEVLRDMVGSGPTVIEDTSGESGSG